MKYHFRIHTDPDGLWAECLELKGCDTQSEANTKEDLYKNMETALNLYLDEPDLNVDFPTPDDSITGDDIALVQVEPRIAFALSLRHTRIKNHLTQKEMAARIGFKNLWSYQRLEAPKSNPGLDTIAKVKKAVPELDMADIF